MPRFFVAAAQVSAGRAVIEGADAAHLARSLRTRPGERLVVVDDAGREHGVVVDEVSPERVGGSVDWSRPATGEPRLRVTVIQALPQQDMDAAIEAMVEAGAATVRPVLTARCIARPDAARAESRRRRWATIAREAAALAGRGRLPEVVPLTTLDAAVAALAAGTLLLACAPGAPVPLAGLRPYGAAEVAAVIGPEGGLTDEELSMLGRAGAQLVHLGPRVLRARLAGAVATALLLARAGDLDSGPAVAGASLGDDG